MTQIDDPQKFFSFEGHAFNDQDRCVCAGYDNGDIKLFDLRNMSLRWEKNIKNGVSFFLFVFSKGFAFDQRKVLISICAVDYDRYA